ncbi:hypothetical protein BZA77DRAFT_296830 [Pyronema omphalodes]|nr:hypothetical protein BZA77DRAFT_296830 [Pyronema omphalodes]
MPTTAQEELQKRLNNSSTPKSSHHSHGDIATLEAYRWSPRTTMPIVAATVVTAPIYRAIRAVNHMTKAQDTKSISTEDESWELLDDQMSTTSTSTSGKSSKTTEGHISLPNSLYTDNEQLRKLHRESRRKVTELQEEISRVKHENLVKAKENDKRVHQIQTECDHYKSALLAAEEDLADLLTLPHENLNHKSDSPVGVTAFRLATERARGEIQILRTTLQQAEDKLAGFENLKSEHERLKEGNISIADELQQAKNDLISAAERVRSLESQLLMQSTQSKSVIELLEKTVTENSRLAKENGRIIAENERLMIKLGKVKSEVEHGPSLAEKKPLKGAKVEEMAKIFEKSLLIADFSSQKTA